MNILKRRVVCVSLILVVVSLSVFLASFALASGPPTMSCTMIGCTGDFSCDQGGGDISGCSVKCHTGLYFNCYPPPN
jgi:hypothetical protein